MKHFERQPQPDFLKEKASVWNKKWTELKKKNPRARFKWYVYKQKPVNLALIPYLSEQTQNHCSYCDFYPPRRSDNTIDHFFPKSNSAYYALAFAWHNLYLACDHCQQSKKNLVSALLLRPDAKDYDFSRYFIYNVVSHQIAANPAASLEDRLSALETIRIFDFNHIGQVTLRRQAFERWSGTNANIRMLDDFPFRFLFT